MARAAKELAAFKADPTGPMAAGHLHSAMKAVETIKEPQTRRKCARAVAAQLIDVVDKVPESRKEEVTSVIGLQFTNPSTTKEEMTGLIRMPPPKSGPRDTSIGDSTCFKIQIEKLVRQNPQRFAGLGEMSINVDGDGSVRVTHRNILPEKVKPWVTRRKWQAVIGSGFLVAVATAALIAFTGSTPSPPRIVKMPTPVAVPVERREPPPAPVQETKAPPAPAQIQESRQEIVTITPEDQTILDAVAEATRSCAGTSLNLRQIFSVYNYVTKNVRYMNVSHPSIPRLPKLTLESGIGDCKSMAVLLASMLEAIGAKTVLIKWHDVQKNEGHEYIGVLLGENLDETARQDMERKVIRRISGMYSERIDRFYGGHVPSEEIHFREFTINGKRQFYLLLDATFGRNSLPGMANHREDIEAVEEARVGQPGQIPALK